jgi:hypothetical protein
MEKTMTDKTYNGWTNYPTWAFKLHLDNDEYTYDMVQGLVKDSLPEGTDAFHKDNGLMTDEILEWVYRVTRSLEDYLDERVDDSTGDDHLLTDLVGYSTGQVNFREVAKAYVTDYYDEFWHHDGFGE